MTSLVQICCLNDNFNNSNYENEERRQWWEGE